jgi:hypothetical protein
MEGLWWARICLIIKAVPKALGMTQSDVREWRVNSTYGKILAGSIDTVVTLGSSKSRQHPSIYGGTRAWQQTQGQARIKRREAGPFNKRQAGLPLEQCKHQGRVGWNISIPAIRPILSSSFRTQLKVTEKRRLLRSTICAVAVLQCIEFIHVNDNAKCCSMRSVSKGFSGATKRLCGSERGRQRFETSSSKYRRAGTSFPTSSSE